MADGKLYLVSYSEESKGDILVMASSPEEAELYYRRELESGNLLYDTVYKVDAITEVRNE